MVRHKNDYGYWEEVDRLPVPGCGCEKCSRAADRDAEREIRRSQRRSGGWQPGGSVDGGPAKTRQSGDRTEALWGGDNPQGDGDNHGHIVSNDGVNADYVRYPGEKPIVNRKRGKRSR